MQVCSVKTNFNKIVIPANDSNIAMTADNLLEKYGIHADVKTIDTLGGGGVLSFPYSFFHSFFSFFSSNPAVDKSSVAADPAVDKSSVAADPVDADPVAADDKSNSITDIFTPSVDKSDDVTTANDVPTANDDVTAINVVDDATTVVDDAPVVAPIIVANDNVVTDDSKYKNKSLEIIIKSIDGVRSW